MSAIGPGDLVVCVDARSGPIHLGNDCTPAEARICIAWLVEGRVYRVTEVKPRLGKVGLRLAGDPLPAGHYCADRFRKLNDTPDDAELIARIKSCHPIRKGQPA